MARVRRSGRRGRRFESAISDKAKLTNYKTTTNGLYSSMDRTKVS